MAVATVTPQLAAEVLGISLTELADALRLSMQEQFTQAAEGDSASAERGHRLQAALVAVTEAKRSA